MLSRSINQSIGDLFLFAQLVLPFDSGIGPDAVVKHKVPQYTAPGSVLRQGVVILGCDFLDLPVKKKTTEVKNEREEISVRKKVV